MGKTTKTSYLTSYNKKFIRNRVIPHGKKLIGLGGPDIEEYTRFIRSKGYKSIRVWENNPIIYSTTLPKIPHLKIQYNIEDILRAPVEKDVVYDLDFCQSIDTLKPHIQRFKENFILTLSERGKPKFSSLLVFASYRSESIQEIIEVSENDRIMITNKGKYVAYRYWDTSPMLVIKPLNI